MELPWYLKMYLHTPVPLWVMVLILVIAAGALIWKWKYFDSAQHRCQWLILLIAYCTFIVCHTLVFREATPEARCILEPFWNYKLFSGNELEDFGEIVMNMALYVPVGVLAAAGWLVRKDKNHKNPSVGCEAIASGANACPSESSSKLGTSAEQSSSPSTFGGSQPTEAKNQKYLSLNSSSAEAKKQRFAKNLSLKSSSAEAKNQKYLFGGHWFWWVVALGCSFSFIVEILQLILHRGLCETDDVIHNTVGCAIGGGMTIAFLKLRNAVKSWVRAERS